MRFRSSKSRVGPREDGAPESSTLRAFALLERIAAAVEPPTLDELTRASGLPKPTVYRILALLARGGLAARDAFGKRYLAGPRLAALSLAVQMRSPANGARHAILARLVEEIGETCNLTMLDGAEVVYLDRVETSANVRLHMKAGSRVPLHCTASGKLFLAHLPHAQLRPLLGPGPLKRYTDRTITAIEPLAKELRRIRAADIATDVGEYLVGSVCIAVPVRDAAGRPCAAIAVHGPAPRMTLRKGLQFVPALRRAADAMSPVLAGAGAAASPTPPSPAPDATAIPGASRVPTRHHHRGDHRSRAEEEGQSRRARDAVRAD